MKLKITHQNQENRKKQEELEKKTMEMDQMEKQPQAQKNVEPSPPVAAAITHPMLGKRKRKAKELIDEVNPLLWRVQKKKTSPPSKSKHGLESGGASTSKGDAAIGGSSTPVQSKSPTMIRAEEVQASLGTDQPNFLKSLVRSHVASCFWMGLPVPFCKKHLPSEDKTVVLENEEGEEFPIKYIAHKTGLSAGWRKFAGGNKLLEGDVLIFQLIGPCRFKVYIVRANDLNEVDGALSLLILDSQPKPSDAGIMDSQSKKKKRPKSLPLAVVQKKNDEAGAVTSQLGHPDQHSGNYSEEVASEVLEGYKSSGSSCHFKDVHSFEEFHIMVDGVCIDSEFPDDIRRKYYELCRSKDAFLHEGLFPGINIKIAAGAIWVTVEVADAIQGCKLTTPKEDYEKWEKSMMAFELLGLNVGFLSARLKKLMSLAFDSEGAAETRRYMVVKSEKSCIDNEIESLEAKLVALKELSARYDNEVGNLKAKAEGHEMSFQEEANAPW